MAIHIHKIDDRKYTVNNKTVTLDTDDHWIAHSELTQYEREAFFKHLNA